jgi:hypothetical protein
MGRLNKKVENEDRYIANNFKREKGESVLNACDNYNAKVYKKLGELEDLEEEIGCPLEMYVSIHENGIYIKDDDEMHDISPEDL